MDAGVAARTAEAGRIRATESATRLKSTHIVRIRRIMFFSSFVKLEGCLFLMSLFVNVSKFSDYNKSFLFLFLLSSLCHEAVYICLLSRGRARTSVLPS